MEAFDLFAEFDTTAREYGWQRLGQPERLLRRYGKRIDGAEVTVRVYANATGTAIVRVNRQQVNEQHHRLGDDLRANVAAKRDTALGWLRLG